MQRLFSTFANGWPGKGLIALRLALASYLFHDNFSPIGQNAGITSEIPRMVAAVAGVFVLTGLWTPIASSLIALMEVFNVLSEDRNSWASVLAGAIALSLAALGPGAHSVDAHTYGRKRISIPKS